MYAAYNGVFKEGWIPDNYFGGVVAPIIQGDYGKVSNLKSFTNTLFSTNSFPDLLYHINGRWVNTDGELIADSKIESLLFKEHEKVIFKNDNSYQGLGIQIFKKTNFNISTLKELPNGVFQYFIEQHPFFNLFSKNCVATIRINTLVDNNGVSSVNGAFLRLGGSKDDYITATSQVKIPVDLDTGVLQQFGYVKVGHPLKNIKKQPLLLKVKWFQIIMNV